MNTKPSPRLLTCLIFAGLVAAASPAAAKGPKLDVGDDPSIGESTAGLVVIEVADFQ